MTTALAKIDNDAPALRRTTAPGARLPLPTAAELQALTQYANIVLKSGIAPAHFKAPEAVLVVMRYGHQLGIDEFTALQNMFVIGGKPTMMASLMHGLILREHGPNAIQIEQQDERACVLICRPRGANVQTRISFTMAEADKAGLPNKNTNWKTYPTDMLFSRAVSRAARRVFRDTTLGMYTPEELDANVIEVDGEIIVPSHAVVDVIKGEILTEHDVTEVVEESFDERLWQATGLTGRAQKEALAPILAEVVAEEDTDKARKLITHLPTYAQAENTMTYLFEKHNIHTPEMTASLKARADAPTDAVDVASGEIVDG